MKAVTKYGKDYKQVASVLKKRTQEQVRNKVQNMLVQVKSNSKHENSKYAKILKKLPFNLKYVWTDKEKKKYNAALLKYGCSSKNIVKHFPTMTH